MDFEITDIDTLVVAKPCRKCGTVTRHAVKYGVAPWVAECEGCEDAPVEHDDSSNLEYVTQRTWNSYALRIEKENLRKKGRSLTAAGISRYANSFVIETRGEDEPMLVRAGWRAAMKAAASDRSAV